MCQLLLFSLIRGYQKKISNEKKMCIFWNMEKGRKGTAHDSRQTILWHGHEWLPMELVSCSYWWYDSRKKWQDEFTSVYGYIIWSDFAKCFKTHWTMFHSTDGQWPEAYFESNPWLFEAKEWNVLHWRSVNPIAWIQMSLHFTCWWQK